MDSLGNLRRAYHISQEELAFTLGVSVQSIRNWEQNRTKLSNASYNTIKLLKDYFFLSYDYLDKFIECQGLEVDKKNSVSC